MMKMRYLLLLSVLFLVLSCRQSKTDGFKSQSDKVEKTSNSSVFLYVYNMGNVPQKDVDKLIKRLKALIFKVAIHELGHSVARLVSDRKDLRCHCPSEICLMRDACNGYPYRNVNSFCVNCSKEMEAKGFYVGNMDL